MTVKKKQSHANSFDVQDFLRSWATVQSGIKALKAEQIRTALDIEKTQKNRPSIIARLATRYDNLTKSERIKELV